MAEVVLRKLTKRFNEVEAVSGVSLHVSDGEFLVLLGPSGCGKSTILRLIAGLEDADSGEIEIGGKLVNFVDPVRRNVAMVFQNYALYPHKTVYRNISFPLQMAKHGKAGIDTAVRQVAATLQLDELLDRLPEQLSGGQRQRVALARAIVREPQAFLMDEPLSNLDAQLRLLTRLELIQLHQRLGITTLYVTHDQIEAMTMGSRIAIMRHGVIQQLGEPKLVYDRPANTFVARFIGSPPMNMLEGALSREPEGWLFRGAGLDLPLSADELGIPEVALGKGGAGPVQLGIRPEHVRLSGPGTAGIPGRVQLIEQVGSDLYLNVHVGGATVDVRTDPDRSVVVGENVVLTLDARRIHLFNAEGVNLRLLDDSPAVREPALSGSE